MKTCTKCKVQYAEEANAFAKNVRAVDGLQAHCKECMSKANKLRREKVKAAIKAEKAKVKRQEYMKAYNEKYRKENHSHKLDLTQQWRVRQAGGVVVEEVDRAIVLKEAGGVCQAEGCGKPITLETMHLDHIKSVASGGEHSYMNVQALCGPCNLSKGSA
jgi:5-methylcytosine-specific restriction endonuclease McrA